MFDVDPQNPELLAISKYSIGLKTDYLLSYFRKFERIFQKESEQLKQIIIEENDRTKDHDDDSSYDYRAVDSLLEIEFTYLRMHRYSVILAAYAYLENSMNKQCEKFEMQSNIPISVSDLSGDGISRCYKYLTKLVGLDLGNINRQWSEIQTLNKFRNCIVHADGDVNRLKNPDKFMQIVKKNNELSLIDEKLVMPSPKFIEVSIKNIKDLLDHISC